MHYVTIPAAIEGIASTKDGKSVPLPFSAFLGQFVWSDPSWRKDGAAVASFVRTSDAIATAEAGAVVDLLDEDWERLEAIVRGAHEQFEPSVVVPLMKFVLAVSMASTTRPGT